MKRMTKAQVTERDAHQTAVQAAWSELDDAVTEFNAAKEKAWAKIEDAKAILAQKIEAANEWRSGIESDARSYFDDRSEKWQEGDAGQAYSEWLDTLGTEFTDPSDDITEPDDLEAPEDPSDAIGDMAESPEG